MLRLLGALSCQQAVKTSHFKVGVALGAAVECGKVGWEARGLSPSGLPARSLEVPPWRFRSYFWLSLSLRVLGQPTLSSRSVLQSQDDQLWSRLTSPAVSAGSGCLAKRCAASDPNLHPGQLVRGAALELEAAGRLAI